MKNSQKERHGNLGYETTFRKHAVKLGYSWDSVHTCVFSSVGVFKVSDSNFQTPRSPSPTFSPVSLVYVLGSAAKSAVTTLR